MSEFSTADRFQITFASGWIDLGNLQEAESELALISAENSRHPDVLEVRLEIVAKRKDWEECFKLSKDLINIDIDRVAAWILRAYSARRIGGDQGLKTAFALLAPAADLFPKEPIIPFNLACYSCQLGKMRTARSNLKKAFQRGDQKLLTQMALCETDLEPLWAEIKGKGKKVTV